MPRPSSHAFSFQDINVNVIEENSGIFIGETHANHWSSRVKENHGIGEISQSDVRSIIGIVQDNDQRDVTHLEKNTLIKQTTTSGDARDIDININGIKVNFVASNSSISTGINEHEFGRAITKDNFGTGEFIGINHAESVINFIDDRDVVDQFLGSNSSQASVQNQSD